MTLKNNRTPLLCYFKLCAAFHSHWWIQTGVTVRERPIWVKIDDFLAVWPWNLTDDLEKQQGTSPKHYQAICIISSPYVNSIWSYSPETAKLGQIRRFLEPCDLEIWWMTLKNNKPLFCATSSFVQHSVAIGEFKLELQYGNAQSGSNSTIFRAVWPWNLTDDLEKQ